MSAERGAKPRVEIPGMSFYDRTLYMANRVRSLEEIPVEHRMLVVPHQGFFSHLAHRHQIDEGQASHLVVALIRRQLQEQLAQQQDEKRTQEEMDVLVINDNSHRKVVGIHALSARQIEIIEVNRTEFGKSKETIVTNPHLEAEFFDGQYGRDFRLSLKSNHRANPKSTVELSSDGDHPYPGFTISTHNQVLFARADKSETHSLSAIWKDKGLEWHVSGYDWEELVKEHLKREKERLTRALQRRKKG